MNAQELNELVSVLDKAAYPRYVTWHAAPRINPNAVIAYMQAKEKYRKRLQLQRPRHRQAQGREARMSNFGRFVVCGEALAMCLGLPEDAHIRAIFTKDDIGVENLFEIVVEHQSLPPVADGEQIPSINPLFAKGTHGLALVEWGVAK